MNEFWWNRKVMSVKPMFTVF